MVCHVVVVVVLGGFAGASLVNVPWRFVRGMFGMLVVGVCDVVLVVVVVVAPQ